MPLPVRLRPQHAYSGVVVDDRTKELVAMGAAAAANCHPCIEYHLAKCDGLGIDREEVVAAVKVGLMVNRGAERAISRKARELLGEDVAEAGLPTP